MKRQALFGCVCAAVMGGAFGGEFPIFSVPRAVTFGPKEHLFASYYASDAWDASGRYATVLETAITSGLPTEKDASTLDVVDFEGNHRFIPLTETRCWNFQETTMAHWLGTSGTGPPVDDCQAGGGQ